MHALAEIYHPITGTPFQNDDTYCEIAPCDALKPYIRCFWGTKRPVKAVECSSDSGIVIPDTCMDIIFHIDYTKNTIDGHFCALDERSFLTSGAVLPGVTSTFAIRFYAWSAILFAESALNGSKNQAFPMEEFFQSLKNELQPQLFEVTTLAGRISIAEKALLKRLRPERVNNDLLNAIYCMIESSGRVRISDICRSTAVSEKQLERIFSYHMGISPKSFSSLIRYQLVWQEMMNSPQFDTLDAVEKYGYTDQAHLLNDFKRRHLMTPREAVTFAAKRR